MNTFLKSLTAAATVIVAIVIISSCKKDFDSPPVPSYPNVDTMRTISIKDLKAMHQKGHVEAITGDSVIVGTVVADDKSGNFYQSVIIEDETGGILIRMAGSNLYTQYPVGRKVAVKCSGLYMGDYNGLIQLGGGIDNTSTPPGVTLIANGYFDNYVVKGSLYNPVVPTTVKIADLDDSYQNMLIKIDSTEFTSAELGSTYGDPTRTVSAVNFDIENCGGDIITLRNSSYANFAAIQVPQGKGSLTGIYGVFGTSKQIQIRDTTDVQFYGPRCDGSTGNNGGGGNLNPKMNLVDLRALYTGTDIKVTGNYSIGGIVIGTASGGSLSTGNIVIQDGDYGISVYFGKAVSYNLGDSVLFNITGDSLINYKGSLEVKVIGSAAVSTPAHNQVITPKVMTVAEINTAFGAALGSSIENTLVKIKSVTASPAGATYANTKSFSDGNSIAFFTRDASYSSSSLPSGGCYDVVGIVTPFSNKPEIKSRLASDVTVGSNCSGGGGGGGTTPTKTVAQLRAMFPGSNYTIPSGTVISGIVISDAANKNVTAGSVILQQGNSGVMIYFGGTISLNVGDSIVVDVSGFSLEKYNNALEIYTPVGTTVPTAVGSRTITPAVMTIAALKTSLALPLSDPGNVEGTLVQIANATATPAGTYKGNKTLTDASANMTLFTGSSATFANDNMPTAAKTWTGYALNYTSGPEFIIRNPATDVQ
ncbi:DUF5689 domain-containing protein [Ferruginibacter albus]|uniref:DUF5689 domain-containing protein n=1 Tax=Ferruginibacter albus TaxID=2875540 RepID=UPI001CC3C88C|nr:DUF5689 domain-containing protein [Ferruginibacter albus]UAY52973.1 DUF5689 domain-containing protein [Ferruginibacter albus]